MRKYEKWVGYSFIAPTVIFLLLLMIYPLFHSFYISLTDARVGTVGKYIGLANYKTLFHQDIFIQALVNSAIYTIFSVILKTALGLLLAMLLEKAKYGKSVLRAVLLLPWVVPASMSVLAWQWMFDPTYSLINWILVQLGGKAISWLGSPFWARTAVITINVWRGIPFFAIGFTAGLTSIPIELYESASMDGAGEIRKFFRITLPLLMPVFSIILLYSIVQTISDFETIFILTRGGPMESTHLLGTVAFFIGLAGTELGKGAAISLFIFPVLFMAAFFAIRTVIKNENF